jgi:hypothetical protein
MRVLHDSPLTRIRLNKNKQRLQLKFWLTVLLSLLEHLLQISQLSMRRKTTLPLLLWSLREKRYWLFD